MAETTACRCRATGSCWLNPFVQDTYANNSRPASRRAVLCQHRRDPAKRGLFLRNAHASRERIGDARACSLPPLRDLPGCSGVLAILSLVPVDTCHLIRYRHSGEPRERMAFQSNLQASQRASLFAVSAAHLCNVLTDRADGRIRYRRDRFYRTFPTAGMAHRQNSARPGAQCGTVRSRERRWFPRCFRLAAEAQCYAGC
ncbi:hypothetical protein LMG9964_00630 [Paraburkholderia phenoliruptrix]|uniref:Uncharacterized protein n=1 Tax=Paraburkholderia phenoliruptrix TaxID=252970 RepID=A0A6J5K0E2_9BURK|nr:hypothetical protein [Paraburkholderia phenoliruptrix]CAB4046998.1 hypothetical protein LMG9964_00630 [Paraburkholderia phenoliruptrix]